MKKQEYVEYLNEELKKSREIALEITSTFKDEKNNDDWIKGSPFENIISIVQGGLNYLSDTLLEDTEGFFSNYKSELNVIEAYSLENEIEVLKNTYWKDNTKIYGFYSITIQIIRAILAVQYAEMGVEVECQVYESDDPDCYIFSLEKTTKEDIWKSAFDYIGFKCPLTNAKYKFFSFEDRNEVELIKEVA